jgi:hypothetical protein
MDRNQVICFSKQDKILDPYKLRNILTSSDANTFRTRAQAHGVIYFLHKLMWNDEDIKLSKTLLLANITDLTAENDVYSIYCTANRVSL